MKTRKFDDLIFRVDAVAMKRITFRADAEAIERARRVAKAQGTTLQEEFRKWLSDYIEGRWVSAKKVPEAK